MHAYPENGGSIAEMKAEFEPVISSGRITSPRLGGRLSAYGSS
jgi:hypothetical protein